MSDAMTALEKIRNEKKVKAGKSTETNTFYPRLIVYPLRRRQLGLAMVIVFWMFVGVLAKHIRSGESAWFVSCLPIFGLGLMITIIPVTEEWEYKPWQAKARQYERHQIEK